MKTFRLKGYRRNFVGKKASKTYRKELHIPCILYGGREKIIHFNVLKSDLCKLIYTSNVYIIELNIEDVFCCAILKEKQFHPVTDEVLHVDFLRIYEDIPSVIEIPIELEGLAEGVKLGGKLSLEMKKLKVRGSYKNFPDKLTINVNYLGLGKKLLVGDLSFNKLDLLNDKDDLVAAVKLTRMIRSAVAVTK